jgi:hypothetical protein
VLEGFILDLLLEIHIKHLEIIDLSVDVYEEMGIVHARNMGVSESDIDSMNGWQKFEVAQGRRLAMPMRDHYSQKVQMIGTFLQQS